MQDLKMPNLKELEIAVLFWADGDPNQTLATLARFDVRCGHLGLRGYLDLSCASEWNRALRMAEFTVSTVCPSMKAVSRT